MSKPKGRYILPDTQAVRKAQAAPWPKRRAPKINPAGTVEEHSHLNKLHNYLDHIEADPTICDSDIAPAAIDWISGEIAGLEKDLFGVKSKSAALAGS